MRTGKREFVFPTALLRKTCTKLKARLPEDEGNVTYVDLTGVDGSVFEVLTQYLRTGLHVT